MNQRDTILAKLRNTWYEPVCGVELLDMHIPRYAARINELRDKGHTIDTVPCPYWHHTHHGRIASYQLREGYNAPSRPDEVDVVW